MPSLDRCNAVMDIHNVDNDDDDDSDDDDVMYIIIVYTLHVLQCCCSRCYWFAPTVLSGVVVDIHKWTFMDC